MKVWGYFPAPMAVIVILYFKQRRVCFELSHVQTWYHTTAAGTFVEPSEPGLFRYGHEKFPRHVLTSWVTQVLLKVRSLTHMVAQLIH